MLTKSNPGSERVEGLSLKPGARIALFIWSFSGGGVERMTTRLAGGLLQRGYNVDIVVLSEAGPNRQFVPEGVRVIPLERYSRTGGLVWALSRNRDAISPLMRFPLPELLRWLPGYCRYLETAKPDLVVSAMPHCNLPAAAAKRFCEVPFTLLTERNPISTRMKLQPSHMRRFGRFVPALYQQADALAGISKAVSEDLANFLALPGDRVSTIYNPAFDPEIPVQAKANPEHPWFSPSELASHPIILGVGRLHPQKGFETLLRAFAQLRKKPSSAEERGTSARLVILGTGTQRRELQELAHSLDIAHAFDLPGYVLNPFAYMARASAFVLPSLYEGFGNVLVEALACGCPVIASTGPGGATEILDHGQYGPLIEPGNYAGFAEALIAVLVKPISPEVLRMRARTFSVQQSIDAILELVATKRAEPAGVSFAENSSEVACF